jgi:hypothetical protein
MSKNAGFELKKRPIKRSLLAMLAATVVVCVVVSGVWFLAGAPVTSGQTAISAATIAKSDNALPAFIDIDLAKIEHVAAPAPPENRALHEK